MSESMGQLPKKMKEKAIGFFTEKVAKEAVQQLR